MSVSYVRNRKTWNYDFMNHGHRYTGSGFETKAKARQAEAERRKEAKNPTTTQTVTDYSFIDLANKRLDHIKIYHSKKHYVDSVHYVKRWVKLWKNRPAKSILQSEIYDFIVRRSKVSGFTANKEIRLLRALFNFGKKYKLVESNPVDGIDFLPVEKPLKYVPPKNDVLRLIMAGDSEQRDYLWTISLSLARVNEVNALLWDDIDFKKNTITLYTRKKKGGNRTGRLIPMNEKLRQIMTRRFESRDKTKPWVFWHHYFDRKQRAWIDKPYVERSMLMETLCEKAGVRHFGFHALRHYGASMMDNSNVPIGSIQKILGHENRTTTEIYLHSVGENERLAMDILNGEFENFHRHFHRHVEKEI